LIPKTLKNLVLPTKEGETMTESLTMAALYGKLSEIGLKKNYVRKNGLPSWWDEELNDKPVVALKKEQVISPKTSILTSHPY
jgi:putative ubiquitin-RnfH superfamily antitoxin RatB of RatAB toxin-antitoxin module